jgi:hypothetical protein
VVQLRATVSDRSSENQCVNERLPHGQKFRVTSDADSESLSGEW